MWPAPSLPATVSATITPVALPWHILDFIHLPAAFPIVAASVEVRAHPRIGVAVMGLAGDEARKEGVVNNYTTFSEIGAEPRWYPRDDFRGMMVGVAVHHFQMAITDVADDVSFYFAGYIFGPFVGYKYTAPLGFTFEAKAGFEVIKRTVSDAGDHRALLPITDARVGWSF